MKNKSLLIALVAAVVLLQLLSRFGGAPVCDFTLDDWGILLRSQHFGWVESFSLAIRDPDRPVAAVLLTQIFSMFGDHPPLYAILSAVSFSVFIALLVWLVVLLTRRLDAALFAGFVFAVLPNLTESFLWPTMICYAPGLICYPAAAIAFVHYTRRPSPFTGLATLFLLLIALANYEAGIGLSVALLALVPLRETIKSPWKFWPVLTPPFLYLVWKFTHGFGLARGFLFVPRKLEISTASMFWNTTETVGWWTGRHFLASISNGLSGLQLATNGHLRFLLACNFAAIALILFIAKRTRDPQPPAPENRTDLFRCAIFGILWFALSAAISLVSWTGGRLNLLPAVGLAMTLGSLAALFPAQRWFSILACTALLMLPANEGTALQWRESGAMQRRLFNFVRASAPEWREKNIVLFDTARLRERLAPDLRHAAAADPQSAAFFGNAGLLRGFAPQAMLDLSGNTNKTVSVLDVECDAHFAADALVWHNRYAPDAAHSIPRKNVFVIDCLSATRTE